MKQATVGITVKQKGRFLEWVHLIVGLVLEGVIPLGVCIESLRVLVARFAPDRLLKDDAPEPKHNLAEEVRAVFEAFYRNLGFAVSVPIPLIGGKPVSNREIRRRAGLEIPQELMFRAASSLISYKAFVTAVGQGKHWTVADVDARSRIGWEAAKTGYWFWAEVSADCPRLKTSRNDLMQTIRLLCLEEYVIVWYMMQQIRCLILDRSSWSCLRTTYRTDQGPGALSAYEGLGVVSVYGSGPGALSRTFVDRGGRSSEVVA